RVPNRGIGYGILRYLCADADVAARLRALPQAEVMFNYLGQVDQTLPASSPLRPAQESSGPNRSPRGVRRYLLEINGIVAGGRLQLTWTYGEQVHRHATVERLAEGHAAALRAL